MCKYLPVVERVLGAQKLATALIGGLAGSTSALANLQNVSLHLDWGKVRCFGDDDGGGESSHGEHYGYKGSGNLHACSIDVNFINRMCWRICVCFLGLGDTTT